ncbi:MAG: citrate (Si)-synthase [Proteobacteria bacterium]|nr:MAG: citrate (Si)-synthase [Pseudomonadota bacterium]
MTKHTVTLSDSANAKQIELDVLKPTLGPEAVDVRKLYKETGYFTYDPGYLATASCSSAITYLDGEAGTLLYRGYPIEQLAEQSTFIEVCYLLFYGELPSSAQLANFEQVITRHTMLHDQVQNFYRGFRRDAHPMATMVGVVGALSAFYHDDMDIHDPAQRERSAHRLIAKMPTIASWSYRYAVGLPFNNPWNAYSYAEDFLHLMFSVPTEERYKSDPLWVKALDVILILHADHEQNASTSTVRLAGSSEANPFAAVAAGIASLWGPAHGGANEAVINMLREIEASDQPLSYWISRAKDKDDRFRLMGFGHRVYKNYDPRAKIIRKLANAILDTLPSDNPNQKLFDIARELEQIALSDDYFKERNLYPNVDFYSGVIFLSMGIPVSMFTVMFALGRTIGWISQWNEMMGDEEARIGRPRQLYVGKPLRDYIPLDQR